MIRIRKNTFETNSSSTHAFAFYKENKPEIDFENYEETIEVYLDDNFDYPIHTFDDLKSKLRYFYTQYCRYWKEDDDGWYNMYAIKNFMEIIFKILPKVTWVAPPEDRYSIVYMEDGDCVWESNYWGNKEELYDIIKDEETMKRFLQNGVIYFGSRDIYDPVTYHTPWEDVYDDNPDIQKIIAVTG